MSTPEILPVNSAVAASAPPPATRWQISDRLLQQAFGLLLFLRFYYPFFTSPLDRLYSDPARHWDNGHRFLQPSFMGSSDPLLYQVWIYGLQQLSGGAHAVVEAGCGLLCALMPWGWYRALREVLPKRQALWGGLVMGGVPVFIGAYGYFMNETLLMSLTGVAFWATFRSHRKKTVGAFALACALWVAAMFTRSLILPMAGLCLGWLWLSQGRRVIKAAIGLLILLTLLIPAGLHGRMGLGYFAPFGGLYLNEIYRESGYKNINIDLGPHGSYGFGSPSFYNQTFYPFSDWQGNRSGTVAITIDISHGEADWQAQLPWVVAQSPIPRWADYLENWAYLFFGQSWPQNNLDTPLGWLGIWTRWLWPPLILWVAVASARCRFRGIAWLLPVCGLSTLLFLALQRECIIEGRYRMPLDPLFVASAVILCSPRRRSSAHDQPE